MVLQWFLHYNPERHEWGLELGLSVARMLDRSSFELSINSYVIFYGDFERPLRRRFREVFAKFSRSFSEKTAPKKFLEMIVFIAAIDFVKFSSKSELSSRFFGRLKFSVRFEYLSLLKVMFKSGAAPIGLSTGCRRRRRQFGRHNRDRVCRRCDLGSWCSRVGRRRPRPSRRRGPSCKNRATLRLQTKIAECVWLRLLTWGLLT